MAGIFICILFISGYYALMILSLRFCAVDFVKIFRDEWWKILIICAAGTAFVFYQVSLQRWIYFWDFAETWYPTIALEQTLFADPSQALNHLYDSINYADYNDFLPILMTLPMHIFGKSFLAYTMYVWVMFALPAIFLIAAATKSLIKKFCGEDVSCAAIIVIILIMPLTEMPVMHGYANVSMMLEGIILFLMLLNLDAEKIHLPKLFLIAVLSVLAVIQNRSAAYMIIGLFFGYAIYKIYLRGNILALLKNFFIIGIIGAGLMTLMFYPLVKHMLTYNHATAYSAYAVGYGVGTRIFANFLRIGWGICLVFFFALWAGWRHGTEKVRPLIIFFTAWIAASDILISRIQFMGMQHYYAILVPFCIVIAAAIMLSFKRNKKICAALILILTLNFAHAYLVTQSYIEINIINQKFNEFQWFKYAPPVRNDVEELRNFIAAMNDLTAGEKNVYLLASSELYNYSSFKQVAMPDVLDAMPNLMGTADIDLRDGFPIHFFDADFVITAAPVQTHMQRSEDQSVVTKLSELVTRTPLQRHFKLINETSLYPAEGLEYRVTLKVYEKISPFDKSELDFVENVFTQLYPDSPALFKDRFESYKAEKFNE